VIAERGGMEKKGERRNHSLSCRARRSTLRFAKEHRLQNSFEASNANDDVEEEKGCLPVLMCFASSSEALTYTDDTMSSMTG